MKKVEGESVFVVKTLKLTDEEGAQSIIQRKEDVRKKRAERNRMKRKQKQAEKKARNVSGTPSSPAAGHSASGRRRHHSRSTTKKLP